MSMKIKKGKLNYDQSGRAYPNNPRVKENWDCIWEYEGKYYKLVGDNEHKEWDEVNIYNQIIDEAYENYYEYMRDDRQWELDKEEFINKCKTDPEFSEKWGLKIEERELSFNERIKHIVNSLKSNAPLLMEEDEKTTQWLNEKNIPTKLITLTYNNETIESYE